MQYYKYVNLEVIKIILEKMTIRFSQPCILNDPFEISPSYLNSIKEINPFGWLEKEDLVTYFSYLFNINYLGLSMTTNSNSTLMWSHYGNEHKGVMIKFNIKSSFFDCQSSQSLLYKVPYSNTRPKFENDLLIEFQKKGILENKNREKLFHTLFTKAKCWNTEQEWRLIKPVSELRTSTGEKHYYDQDTSNIFNILKPDSINHKFTLEFEGIYVGDLLSDTVSALYFGLRTSAADKKCISKLINNRELPIQLYDSYYSDETFEIKYKPL